MTIRPRAFDVNPRSGSIIATQYETPQTVSVIGRTFGSDWKDIQSKAAGYVHENKAADAWTKNIGVGNGREHMFLDPEYASGKTPLHEMGHILYDVEKRQFPSNGLTLGTTKAANDLRRLLTRENVPKNAWTLQNLGGADYSLPYLNKPREQVAEAFAIHNIDDRNKQLIYDRIRKFPSWVSDATKKGVKYYKANPGLFENVNTNYYNSNAPGIRR